MIDQENGISRLQPKVFEPAAMRWKPLHPAANEVGDVSTAAGCPQGRDAPVQPLADFICVTYNVWFDKRSQHARALALFEILRTAGAHVISLQGTHHEAERNAAIWTQNDTDAAPCAPPTEVTPQFLGWLRDQDFVRENYILSDSIGTTLKGASICLLVVIQVLMHG